MHLPLNNFRAHPRTGAAATARDPWADLTVDVLPVDPCHSPRVLPAPVRQFSVVFDPLDVSDDTNPWREWFPAGALGDATPMRRFEFMVGRACAAEALRALGGASGLLVGRRPNGVPVWPVGYTGSITHTIGFVSVAVAPSHIVGAIGIDSEEILSAERATRVAGVFASGAEIAAAQAAGLDRETAITLIFSAKEAVFKGLHGYVRRIFDFHDVQITLVDARRRRFTVAVVNTLAAAFPAGSTLTGSFEVDLRRVHTGTVVPPQVRE